MNSNDITTESKQFCDNGGGFFKLPDRTWLQLTGQDRAAFLHNFCTADIKKLAEGEVTELFILDTRGKTLAFGHVFCCSDSLLISTADGVNSESLRQHLDKYVIREDVEIQYVSGDREDLFVLGPSAIEAANQLIELAQNQCRVTEVNDQPVFLAAIELAGFGVLISGKADGVQVMREFLSDNDVVQFSNDVLKSLRLAHGTPMYGVEIDGSNLPQELRRDEKAISFTKGCYLGQETVAKIDAIGHVNRFLVGLMFEGEFIDGIEIGCDVTKAGAKIGALQSFTFSPFLQGTIGLAYVKRNQADVGNEVVVGDLAAKVTGFPIQARSASE